MAKRPITKRKTMLNDFPPDEWVEIPGYMGMYFAHESGFIKSIYPPYPPRIILGSKDKSGYLQLSMIQNGKKVKRKIHRVIASVFHPNPENKLQVNHLDFDRTNNAKSNLQWATSKEDADHKVLNNRQAKGDMFPNRKGRKLKKRKLCKI